MHLERLELQGFKSFAQKTVLEFAPGITAIVGPNGSGKSNIADAVKWVMGEQSMKTLRSKKLEDVIFAGTSGKSRLGMAEVSLYLDNKDKRMPIEYSHVVLTRRLYRSGESEYLINRNKVRLLDIQNLLASAGFGQKTYSVIGQGMIDRILSAGPKEKKELFEEAAGVKQYQIKKQISLNKLDLTKQNLVHVQGLLEEILPRLRSLKRQANRAQRKEEIEEKLKEIAKKYFNFIWNLLKKRKEAIQIKLEETKSVEEELCKRLDDIKDNLEAIEKKKSFQMKMEDQKALASLKGERDKLQKMIVIMNGRMQLEQERHIPIDLIESDRRAKKLNEKIDFLKQNLWGFERGLQKLDLELREKISVQKNILDEIRRKQKELEFLQTKKTSSPFTLKRVVSRLEEIYRNQSSFFDELDQVENLDELKKLKERGKIEKKDIENLLSALKEEISREGEEEQANFKKIPDALGQLFEKKNKIEVEIGKLKIEAATLKSKRELCKQQINEYGEELAFLNKKIQFKKEGKSDQNILVKKLEREKKNLEKREEALNKKIETLEGTFLSALEEKEREKEKIFNLERNYRKKQEELNKLKDFVRGLEIERAKISTEQKQADDEIKEIFGTENFDASVDHFGRNLEKPEESKIPELRFEMDKLKKQVIQIGEIDPEVLSEYSECEKRYAFLSGQKKDLEEAISSLKKAIGELNRIIGEKFERAFENINEQFQRYFKILFGGGKARLVKTRVEGGKPANFEKEEEREPSSGEKVGEKEDELFADVFIDIKATPPGKRLSNLNMLSGGEKALTSIALILAIIANNPSPFIILDEVDAALDEANSGRYAQILNSVVKKTQFITITHNRETMKYANAIYGATMEKSGITKLLSVKLESIPLNS